MFRALCFVSYILLASGALSGDEGTKLESDSDTVLDPTEAVGANAGAFHMESDSEGPSVTLGPPQVHSPPLGDEGEFGFQTPPTISGGLATPKDTKTYAKHMQITRKY